MTGDRRGICRFGTSVFAATVERDKFTTGEWVGNEEFWNAGEKLMKI